MFMSCLLSVVVAVAVVVVVVVVAIVEKLQDSIDCWVIKTVLPCNQFSTQKQNWRLPLLCVDCVFELLLVSLK
jgi:hypothetical protein